MACYAEDVMSKKKEVEMTFAQEVGKHFKSRLTQFHFVGGDTFINPQNVICVEPEVQQPRRTIADYLKEEDQGG